MDKKLFGTRINKARKDRGLTAEKLAEACNINSTYLRQIEGGKKLPSLPVFATLCRELRVSPNYTLHEREELFLDTIRDDTLPEHIMSAKDCAYIFDVCAAGRVEDAREMLGRFVTAHAAK